MEDRIGRLALAPPPSFCGPISMDTVFLYPGNTSTTCVFPYAFSLGFAFGSAPNLTFPAYFSTAASTSSCVYTNLPLLVSRLNLSGIPAAALELADVILEAALPADCPVRLVARATGAFERVREHPPDTRVAYAQLVLAVAPAESVV